MPLWQIIKASPIAKQTLGEVIQKQDQKYYTTAVDKSLLNLHERHIRSYPGTNSL